MPHTYTNGIVTFYEDASPSGPGPFPAVVLIHGHSVDLRMWQYQVPALLEASAASGSASGGGFRVVRYDVRGHGRSMVPPDGYTWENYAADLGDLLDRINVDRPASESLALDAAHVVGLSMGGGIALQFALDFPKRVLSLTLVDPALPGFTYSKDFSDRIQALVQAVQVEGVWPAFRNHWLNHPLFDGLRSRPEAFALLQEMVRGFQAPEYRGLPTAPEGYRQPQIAERLAEIAAPTLVIAGEDDLPDFRLIADLLAENITGARQAVLPGCGHVPPMEDPDAFNATLIGFLCEVSPAPT